MRYILVCLCVVFAMVGAEQGCAPATTETPDAKEQVTTPPDALVSDRATKTADTQPTPETGRDPETGAADQRVKEPLSDALDAGPTPEPPSPPEAAVEQSTTEPIVVDQATQDTGPRPDNPTTTSSIVGFGAITKGAASSPNGFDTIHVKNLNDSGAGSLRDALSLGRRRIVFDVSGTITLLSPLYVRQDYITLDGETAKGGITITQPPGKDIGLIIVGTNRHTHDLLFRHIRFRGTYDTVNTHKVGSAIFSIDGDCGKIKCTGDWSKVDGGVSNVVLDHISVIHDRDKTTFWGKIRNVTLSNSLFYGSNKALLVSFYGAAYDLQRKGISIYRNLFVDNGERNPQLRGWIDDLEFVNNVVLGWTFYGARIKNDPGEKSINANLLNNSFYDTKGASKSALIYLNTNNPPTCLKQGTVYTTSGLGSLWVDGNHLPADNCDQFSTVTARLPIPAADRLPVLPLASSCAQVAQVGPLNKSAEETKAIQLANKELGCP